MVAAGEETVIAGWLLYGAALNKGRALHETDDRAFGQWLTSSNLDKVHPGDQQAAMWADANYQSFKLMERRHPKVRTVRGLHAKWKEAQTPQVKAAKEVPSRQPARGTGRGIVRWSGDAE